MKLIFKFMSRVGFVEVENPQSEVLKAVKVFLEKRRSDPESELTELSEFMRHLGALKESPQNELLKIICDAAIDLSSRQKENKNLSKRIHKSLEKMEKNFNEKSWDEQKWVVHEAIAAVIMNSNPPPEMGVVVTSNPMRGERGSRPPSGLVAEAAVSSTSAKSDRCCIVS